MIKVVIILLLDALISQVDRWEIVNSFAEGYVNTLNT